MRLFKFTFLPFKRVLLKRPFRLFASSPQISNAEDPNFTHGIADRISALRRINYDPDQIDLYAYLAHLPYSNPMAAQAKIFEDLFSQLVDLSEMIAQEKPESEEHTFYTEELESIKNHLKSEYDRVLPEIVETNMSSEVDSISSAILEFRGGVGGAESLLFAEEMSGYYQSYLVQKGFSVQPLADTSQGGKVFSFRARGEGIYKFILPEAGVHKVIRVPETESRGRLHSSVISIVVLPDVPFEFKLNEKELKYEYMRAQGPGGQHVNKTESACRITHIPTGTSVMMQDDRSQENNRRRALELIRQKLYQMEFEKKMAAEMSKRKSQIGTSDRSDKIRTYNFPQDRITDHRLGKTVYGIESALNSGSIFDECIAEIQEREFREETEAFKQQLRLESKSK